MTDRRSSDMAGLGLAVVSSLCIAVVPSAGKMAMDSGASLIILLITRCLIAVLFLAPIVVLQRAALFPDRQYLWRIMLTSVFGVAMIAGLYGAVRVMDVGLAVLILYMYPIGIALVEHAQGNERIARIQWVSLAAVAGGLALLSFESLRGGNLVGIGLSVAAMICAMMFTIMSSRLARTIGASSVNFATNLWSCIILAALMLGLPSVLPVAMPATNTGWLAIAGNGVFFMLGYLLFFESSRIIGITRTSVVTLVDPLLAALVAILLLGQMLSPLEWTGFFVITGSLLVFERGKQLVQTV